MGKEVRGMRGPGDERPQDFRGKKIIKHIYIQTILLGPLSCRLLRFDKTCAWNRVF
jgi:hypothetical protein